MKSLFPLIALAALAACNQTPSRDAAAAGDAANAASADAVANAAPIELPPAIRLQKNYRCKDQSLVHVTWFVGDKTVNVRDTPTGDATILTSPTNSSPWTSAVGVTLAGDDQNIRVTMPEKGIRDCHA